jgi:DNA-binding PadR family transcriptional regulator
MTTKVAQSIAEPLTELEGAILSEIYHRKRETAFQVRRAFQESPSLEWSGSAGAVYPAVRRLEQRQLLTSERAGDSRGTLLLSITAPGRSALLAWACDPIRSASVGLDPFRLRSGIWRTLSDAKRKAALEKIAMEIQRNVDFLNSYIRDLDGIEVTRVQLSIDVQMLRLRWITSELMGA